MIRVENLKKVFDNGFEALKNINLEIQDGDLVCLLGPSGCGKTTILNLIAGLLDPTSGDILFDGKSVLGIHPKDRGIGLVFQNYALYPHMTVLENVMFPLTVGSEKVPREEAAQLAQKYMAITGITELSDRKPGQMSGGQQQRVAITRALVKNPKVLLLDEPLSNLDARLRLKIREEIRRLVKEIGITTIFVTHDQEEALSISDKIVLMNEGVVQQADEPQNLYLEPENEFVARFMGNPIINMIPMKKEGSSLISRELTLPLAQFCDERFRETLEEGKTYQVGIRPEYFVLDPDGPIAVTAESVELIGKDCIVNFLLNDMHMKTVTDITHKIKEGDTLKLNVAYSSIFIFDETGKRVY